MKLADAAHGLADAAARAVDARRPRRHRRRRSSPRRSTTPRATCARRRSASRNGGWATPAQPDAGGGAEAARRSRTGRCGSSWRRRSARCRPARANGAGVAARAARRRSRRDGCRAERRSRQRGRCVLEKLMAGRRPRRRRSASRDHDGRGDDRARRAGRGGPEPVRVDRRPRPGRRGSATALLRGAEVALLGAPTPGSPAGRRGRLPRPRACRVRPVRADAPARAAPTRFRRRRRRSGRGAREEAPVRGGRSRPGAAVVAAQPRAARLSQLAGAGSELERASRRVLARVEWPGKPGAAAPVAPLTPDEQQRFNAGQEVYRNICQACHQPDGRGQEQARRHPDRLAPRARSRRDPGAHPAQRQGRAGRPDAAGRSGLHRRSDCGRADLHPPRVGAGPGPRWTRPP